MPLIKTGGEIRVGGPARDANFSCLDASGAPVDKGVVGDRADMTPNQRNGIIAYRLGADAKLVLDYGIDNSRVCAEGSRHIEIYQLSK